LTTTYTHFSATINRPGHRFPLCGPITDARVGDLVNYGTTPGAAKAADPDFLARVAAMAARLRAGETVTVGPAVVTPVTAEEYERTR
jgi:hypothetical protein